MRFAVLQLRSQSLKNGVSKLIKLLILAGLFLGCASVSEIKTTTAIYSDPSVLRVFFRNKSVYIDPGEAGAGYASGDNTVSTWDGSSTVWPYQSSRRLFLQNTFTDLIPLTNSNGIFLDPPVVKDAEVTLDVKSIVGSPKVTAWMVNHSDVKIEPTISLLADTGIPVSPYFFGPEVEAPAPPRSSLPLGLGGGSSYPAYKISEFSHTVSLGINKIPLQGTGFNLLIDDSSGESGSWQGVFSIVFVMDGESFGYNSDNTLSSATNSFNYDSTSISIDINYVDFHTGFVNHANTRNRMVRDSRLGMPAAAGELVKDGFIKNAWVQPWDRDPEDEQTGAVRKETNRDSKGVR